MFLSVFSMHNQYSFKNVHDMRYMELQHHCPNTPIVLVGNKIDLSVEAALQTSLSSVKGKQRFVALIAEASKAPAEIALIVFDYCVNSVLGSTKFNEYDKCDAALRQYAGGKVFECSALTGEGLDAVFDFAVNLVLNPPVYKTCTKGSCTVQ